MSACVCLPFASWRLGLARRTGPNVRRRRSNAPTREGRRGPGLGGSCGGAGAGQVGGSGVATSRFARSSWFEAGFRSGHLSAVRSPGRVVARQRDRQATLVATERACTRLVYSCRCRWGEIRIGPPAAGRRESLRAALRPSRISVHGSYSAGDVGRVRPPPRRLVPAPVRTASSQLSHPGSHRHFLTISQGHRDILHILSRSGWTQHAGHVDTGSEYHAMLPPRARAGLHGATRCSPLLRGTARNPTCG